MPGGLGTASEKSVGGESVLTAMFDFRLLSFPFGALGQGLIDVPK